eukprot:symbB.v1.2.011533.t1/scaffold778.1/size163404/16
MGGAWWIPLVSVGLQVAHAGGEISRNLRQLQGANGPDMTLSQCRLRPARMLPTPSLGDYDRCLQGKWGSNSTHDWGVPGAELEALIDCWCGLNMTQAATDLGCCQHGAFQQWCGLDCQPDCQSALATECIQECPPMCFEVFEYFIPRDLCSRCSLDKCFSVMRCLLNRAQNLTESGELERTCHESDFEKERGVLDKYRQCWMDMPKHSTHWNVLSAWIHCMVELATRTDCCKSVTYAGGICEAQCPSERECASQEAQTCIHNSPTEDCQAKCFSLNAPCRKYLGCRTPMLTMSNYVCDDGQWPEASTGCCVTNATATSPATASCPSLCETRLVYRLDSAGVPWWATQSPNIVYQCTCDGCPALTEEGTKEVKQTLEESVWDNGQDLLVDIARRENLELGPNRKMQELMVRRNELVLEASKSFETGNRMEVEKRIQNINAYYTHLITDAARTYPDDGSGDEKWDMRESESAGLSRLLAILLSVTAALVIVLFVVILVLVRRRKQKEQTPVTAFAETDQVVIGSPVPITQSQGKDQARWQMSNILAFLAGHCWLFRVW